MAPHYSATKAALVNLTISLAKELARTGVTVNPVTPSIIHTDGIEGGWGDDSGTIEQNVLREVVDNRIDGGGAGSVNEFF